MATPVLAAVPTSPGPLRISGISNLLWLGVGDRVVAGGLDDLVRKPAEVEENAARVAHRLRDLAGPDVLPDEERGGRVRLQLLGGRLQVLFREESRDFGAEVLESLANVRIEVR